MGGGGFESPPARSTHRRSHNLCVGERALRVSDRCVASSESFGDAVIGVTAPPRVGNPMEVDDDPARRITHIVEHQASVVAEAHLLARLTRQHIEPPPSDGAALSSTA